MVHRKSCWLNAFAVWQFSLTCALGLGLFTSASADPIAVPDASQKAEAQASGPPPAAIAEITDEELPSWKRFAAIPTAGQASSTPAPSVQNLSAPDSSNAAEHQQQSLPVGPLTTQLPRAPALQNSADAEPDLSKSIHEAIKESVRPAYNQLVESGVIETWHDVKASLGLGKNQWSDRDSAEGAAKTPSQWNSSGDASPYPVQPPRTAAQAQMDRELAAMMREKLIDQVTPWLIGLVVLYIVGYLIKLVVHYFRWKSAQRIARAQRQALRRTRTGGSTRIDRTRSPSSSPSESKETV